MAFVDDGSEFRGSKKDSPKIPATTGKAIKLKDIKLLHYIHLEPQRMFSRHRWYKCFEYLENGKRPWDVCLRYQDTAIKTYNAPVVPVRQEWITGFKWLDDYKLTRANTQRFIGGTRRLLSTLISMGTKRFSKLNIWDIDWNEKARLLGKNG